MQYKLLAKYNRLQMINFFRSLFGFGRPAGNRTVARAPVAPDAKEAIYIKNSHRRLNTLHELYLKYKPTPHGEKVNAVLEKTKRIHAYLLANKRVHELELFHIQHTDHFINTYSVIMEVHLRHAAPVKVATPVAQPVAQNVPSPPPAPRQHQPKVYPHPIPRPFEDKVEEVIRKIETETIKGLHTAQKVTEMVRRVAGQAPFMPPTETLYTKAPTLAVPVISIDTYSKIYYVKEQRREGNLTGEIGFTSTDEEKEVFVAHVAARLGIDQRLLKYMGNTILTIPGGPVAYMPVIHWKDCAYAITMHDYRLFPVKMYTRNY